MAVIRAQPYSIEKEEEQRMGLRQHVDEDQLTNTADIAHLKRVQAEYKCSHER